MSRRRYAVVGAGSRSQMYVDAIAGEYADHAELVAICEPNPVRAALVGAARDRRGRSPRRRRGTPTASKSSSAPSASTASSSPPATTCTRRSSSARSMPAPTSSSRSRSRSMPRAPPPSKTRCERTGGDVLLTFNYRYSPRNSALRQVIQDGLIGEVTSIDFSVDARHQARRGLLPPVAPREEELRRPARPQGQPPLRPRQLVDPLDPPARLRLGWPALLRRRERRRPRPRRAVPSAAPATARRTTASSSTCARTRT